MEKKVLYYIFKFMCVRIWRTYVGFTRFDDQNNHTQALLEKGNEMIRWSQITKHFKTILDSYAFEVALPLYKTPIQCQRMKLMNGP